MHSDDDDRQLWDELYDHLADRRGERRRRPPRRRRRLRPGSSERLIDAALGVLGSVRVLVDVAEDVLLDQRDRLDDDGRADAERRWVRSVPDDPVDPDRDTPRTVRDIPFAD